MSGDQVKKMTQSLVYSGKLLSVEPGHIISISGKTNEGADNFTFFLGADNGTDIDFGDIHFLVSVNFDGSGEIVRNSYTKGTGWGDKEADENLLTKDSPNPIKRSDDFKISIFTDVNAFFMSINEKPFCSFDHRKPLAEIRRINIFGDVERIHEVNHNVALPKEPLSATKTCFGGSIPSINPETVIVFTGTPRGTPQSGHFLIGLVGSCSPESLFQVIVKFEDEEVIAVTQDQTISRKIGVVPVPFPFKANKEFKAAIGVTNGSFVFTVNGRNILQVPYDDRCFLGNPANFQLTACGGLELEIKQVDVYVMEGHHMSPKEITNIADENKLLAQIFHH